MSFFTDNTNSPHHTRLGHRCYTFWMEGVIRYDPDRSRKSQPFWCIIELERNITAYYRWQFKKMFGIELHAPAFDAHVSVLRGMAEHTPHMQEGWRYLDGKKVIVHYDSNLYWNNNHVWLNTYCEEYFAIRQHYGVKDWNTKDFSHLTVGKFFAS